ncbi:MAG: phosphatidate cytidylyltransferase [Pseudomonadota bacterium]
MLVKRVLTALILAPLVIGGIFLLPPAGFALFIGVVLTISAYEWADLCDFKRTGQMVYAAVTSLCLFCVVWLPAGLSMPVVMVGVVWWLVALVFVIRYPDLTFVWQNQWVRAGLGLLMMIPGYAALNVLKQSTDGGFWIFLLFMLVWSADVGAYFSGKLLGRRKLAPRVSPGKSWAGLYGGLVVALLFAGGLLTLKESTWFQSSAGIALLAACGVVILVSVLGDLTESMFKRYRGVKDSGHLLPGHGGMLDRIDGLLAASPVFGVLLYSIPGIVDIA